MTASNLTMYSVISLLRRLITIVLIVFCVDILLFQIKVEPPDIRDIDEEEPSGWESPKLVIDLVSCKLQNAFLK